MANYPISTFFILVLVNTFSVKAGKLSVVTVDSLEDENSRNLSLTGANAVNGLDHIWNISIKAQLVESVATDPFYLDLNVTTLNITAEEGDFLVFCEYPLPDSPDFQNGTNADSILNKLPLQNSIFVTSRIRYNDTTSCRINLDGERNCTTEGLMVRYKYDVTTGSDIHRGFVYVHIEPRTTLPDEIITIIIKEEVPPPPPTTTPKLPSNNKDDFYIQRYVKGLTPLEFLSLNRTLIQRAFADIVEEYCIEEDYSDCSSITNLNYIRFSPETDVRFCDTEDLYYHTCVMVSFAVAIHNPETNFTTNGTFLEKVWNSNRHITVDTYLAKYLKSDSSGQPASSHFPNSPTVQIETWIWVTVVLGVMIVFSTLMCYSMISDKVFTVNAKATKEQLTLTQTPEMPGSRKGTWRRLADTTDHPIEKVIRSFRGKFSKRSSLDTDTYTLSDLDKASVSSPYDTNRSRAPDGGFTYRNQAFIDDEGPNNYTSSEARYDSSAMPTQPYQQRSNFQPALPGFHDVELDEEEIEEYNRKTMMF